MNRTLASLAIGTATLVLSFGAFAGGARTNGSLNQSSAATAPTTHHATGQPGAECGSASAPNTPGRAASAPGSAFNPEGRAGQVYAGEQPQNSRNPVSVSQYDTACLHQP